MKVEHCLAFYVPNMKLYLIKLYEEGTVDSNFI